MWKTSARKENGETRVLFPEWNLEDCSGESLVSALFFALRACIKLMIIINQNYLAFWGRILNTWTVTMVVIPGVSKIYVCVSSLSYPCLLFFFFFSFVWKIILWICKLVWKVKDMGLVCLVYFLFLQGRHYASGTFCCTWGCRVVNFPTLWPSVCFISCLIFVVALYGRKCVMFVCSWEWIGLNTDVNAVQL